MNPPEKSSADEAGGRRQQLKFNRDVLPDFKRKSANGVEAGGLGKEERLTEEDTDSMLKWVGIALLVLVVAGVAGIILQHFWRSDEDGGAAGLRGVPSREPVKAAVRAYFRSSTQQERLGMVRRQDEVAPLMASYYQSHKLRSAEILKFELIEQLNLDGRQFWMVAATHPESWEFLIVEEVGGKFLIDWETHVGWNPVSAEEYVDSRPAGRAAFRVYVTPDEYYNDPFDDFDTYLPAKLEFANSRDVIFGYIRKDSRDHRRFLELVDGQKKVPLILELEWPEDPDGKLAKRLPQVEITRLVEERWLRLD